MIERTQGVELVLADGETYTFPPLALASVQALQKRLFAFQGGIDEESMRTVVDAALHSLSRNYPDMTRKQLTGVCREDEEGRIVWDQPALIDLGNMLEILTAVMDISGMKHKEQVAGKVPASNAHLNGSKSIAT